MREELNSLKENNTSVIVQRPEEKPVFGVKWVYKLMTNADGSISLYKSRLVVLGYMQMKRLTFEDTYVSVARTLPG